jgi:hypothetical protein
MMVNRAFVVLSVSALLVGACGGDDGHSCSTCLFDAALILDATSDSPTTSDAPVTSGCPVSFMAIAGGQGTHRYRLINATDEWSLQMGTCAAMSDSAYLAVPDDAAELAAIATLSAASASWVGISDTATEAAYLTVLGGAATYLPWDINQPDDAGPQGEDCVMIQTSSSKLRDEKCNTKFRAVCECEP